MRVENKGGGEIKILEGGGGGGGVPAGPKKSSHACYRIASGAFKMVFWECKLVQGVILEASFQLSGPNWFVA